MSFLLHSPSQADIRPALVTGKLAGIIIGAVIGVIILLVIAVFLYKRHKRKQAALNPKQSTEEEEVGVEEKEKEVEPAPVVPGEMAYASQPAIPHSNGDLVAQQPKVVELGADGVVASSSK
jgi:H+/gluconate symporter-like permease